MTITPEIKKSDILNITNLSVKNAVECKLSILEEEIPSIVYTSARGSLDSVECLNGEIRYSGKAVFYAMLYSGGLKKCEAGVEFSYKQDSKEVSEGDCFCGDIAVENIKVSVNNGIPTVSAMIVLSGAVYKKRTIEYLKDAPELNLKKCQAESVILTACESKNFDLEDEFNIDFPVNDVVWHDEIVCVKSVTSGIGSVSIEGEAEVKALVLIDDGKTEYVQRVIPFNFEKELKSVMPDSICTAKVSVVDSNLKVIVDSTKGKSLVQVSIKVCARTCVHENEPISYIADAYSEDYFVSVEKTPISVRKSLGESVAQKKVELKGAIKFEKNTLLVCPLFAKIEESVVECVNGKKTVKGFIRFGVLVNSDGAYSVETALVPFDIEVDGDCDEIAVLRSEVANFSVSIDGTTLNAEFNLCVAVEKSESKIYGFAVSVDSGRERKKSTSAISVYIPNAGDTLWDIAKNLGMKEEEILKTNSNLQFPLSGEERIVIYREIN